MSPAFSTRRTAGPPGERAGRPGTAYFLALDAGTSGARCVIVDETGSLLATAVRPWSYVAPADDTPYGREFSPSLFWEALCEVSREALARSGLSASAVAAVSTTGQRLGIVLLDGEGREMFASPNLDARALIQGLVFDEEHAGRVYKATGHLPSFLLAPAKLRWLQEEQPQIFARAASLLTVPDWVLFRLTGMAVAQRTTAAEAGLVEIDSGLWAEELLRLWALPMDLLPPLVDAGTLVGAITAEAAEQTGLLAGTPVYAGGPDTQCGLLGLGLSAAGEVGLILGWSGPIQMLAPAPRLDEAARTWTGRHVVPGAFVVEANLQEAGNALRWLAELLFQGDLEEAHRQAGECRGASGCAPASNGILAFLGPGPARSGPPGLRLGGLLFPVPLAAGPPDAPRLFRAALESVAFAVRANLALLEEIAGRGAARIALGGGLARSLTFPTILADILDRPLEVGTTPEASALGAAICAAVGYGLYGWPEAAAAMASPRQAFTPRPSEAAAYDDLYRSWLEMGQALERAAQEMR